MYSLKLFIGYHCFNIETTQYLQNGLKRQRKTILRTKIKTWDASDDENENRMWNGNKNYEWRDSVRWISVIKKNETVEIPCDDWIGNEVIDREKYSRMIVVSIYDHGKVIFLSFGAKQNEPASTTSAT